MKTFRRRLPGNVVSVKLYSLHKRKARRKQSCCWCLVLVMVGGAHEMWQVVILVRLGMDGQGGVGIWPGFRIC